MRSLTLFPLVFLLGCPGGNESGKDDSTTGTDDSTGSDDSTANNDADADGYDSVASGGDDWRRQRCLRKSRRDRSCGRWQGQRL